MVRGPQYTPIASTSDNTIFITEDETVVSDPTVMIPRGIEMNPYEGDDLTRALSRTFLIDTFQWSSTQASDTILALYSSPSVLFNQDYIFSKIKYNQYFRAGTEFLIKMPSMQNMSGEILVCGLPKYEADTVSADSNTRTGKYNSIWQMSCNPHIIMSAATAQEGVFRIPYRAPAPYMVLDGQQPAWCGSLCIRVLSPLAQINSEAAVNTYVNVYARFVEPEVAGRRTEIAAWGYTTINEKLTISGQSGHEPWLPLIDISRPAIERKEVPFAPMESFGFKRGQSEQKSRPSCLPWLWSRKAKPQSGREQKVKTERHLLSTAFKRIADFSSKLSPLPIVGPTLGMMATASDATSTILRALNLDKPTTLEAPVLATPRLGYDLPGMDGLDSSVKLAAKTANGISLDQSLIHIRNNETFIEDFPPVLVDTFTFDSSNATASIMYRIPVSPMVVHSSTHLAGVKVYTHPLAWYGRAFSYWQGPLTIGFRFDCSTMSAAKVALRWEPRDLDNVGGSNEYLREIVDIHGPIATEITVPWLQQEIWGRANWLIGMNGSLQYVTNAAQTNGNLVLEIISPVRTVDSLADSTVNVSVWLKPARGFKYAVPIRPTGWTSEFPLAARREAVAQSGVESFSEPLGPRTFVDRGICMGEEIGDVREMLRRYTFHAEYNGIGATAVSSNTPSQVVPHPLSYGAANMRMFGYLCAPYMAARGSLRFKVICSSGSKIFVSNYQTDGGTGDTGSWSTTVGWHGSAMLDKPLSSEVSVELPYYCPWIYEANFNGASGTTGGAQHRFIAGRSIALTAVESTNCYVFVSGGDDFDVGILSTPPMLYAASWPTPGGSTQAGYYPT